MFGGWQEIKALIDEIRVEELINVFKRLIEIKGKISMGDDFCNDKNYYNEAWLYALKRIISVYPQDRWADIFDLPNDHRSTNFLGAYLSKFYGLPRENYIHLNGKQSVLLNCLRNLPPSSCLVEVFRNQDYDISSLFGFQNAAKASTCSEAPNKFDMLLFKKALIERDLEERWRLLRHDDWIPGPGDYLGPMHYRYALKNLEQRYLQTYTDPSVRIGKILPFVGNFALRNVHQYCQNSRIPKDDGVRHIGLFHWDIQTSNLSYEDSQKCDNLINIVSFLSLFAQVCRADARYPGVLARFSEDMKNYMDNDDDLYMKSFGYILFIGEDILGFYLMLWELIYAADCDAPRRQYVRN